MTFPDYAIILFYMILMVVIGYRYRGASVNFSDYVRMGSRSTWWLAGFSVFMGMFSSITFTGIAGSAYLAGWSVMVIFWCNALMFFIQALFFAPRLRRTRADTAPDAIRLRFGRHLEQFVAYYGTITSFVWGGLFLLSLASFMSVVFGVPLSLCILVVGGVVVFYSVSGGTWSVQITDSLQALLLIPVTFAFAILCLVKVGGVGAMIEMTETMGLGADFALVKAANHEYNTPIPVERGLFTGLWVLAMMFNSVTGAANLATCGRYLSLTDERGAQKAAILAGFFMILGSLVWFIPPVVGRLLFSDQVQAVEGLNNQADAAYAITALNILPPGLLGLIIVSMTAATMSSMDSFLTGSSGVVVKNLYLPLMEFLKKKALDGRKLLMLTRIVSLLLGVWAISMAFILNAFGGSGGIFGIMMATIALIAPPTSLPMILALLVKRIPLWGFFLGMGTGFATSLTILIYQRTTGELIIWPHKVFFMAAGTLIPIFLSRPFWNGASPKFRAIVDNFFVQMDTPIRVQEEVGESINHVLMRAVGNYILLSAVAVACLYFFAGTPEGHAAVVGIALFLLILGWLMRWGSKRALREVEGARAAAAKSVADS